MLTKPHVGWTDFSLEGTSIYGLSYLNDIAIEWLEQAVYGLENLTAFCVHGMLEPNRMLCTVSYWNCHIIVEDEDEYPLTKEEIQYEYSHTSMLEFCRFLYHDINACVDDWACFVDYCDDDTREKNERLKKMLEKLKRLISEKEEFFGENRGFW